MGKVKPPPPVQFFASIIFGDSGILSLVEDGLSQLIGPIAERTGIVPFSQSDYYRPEMGAGLRRYFLLFEPLLGREMLADIKLGANGIEHSASEGSCERGRPARGCPASLLVEGVLNPNNERSELERGGSASLLVEGVLNPNNCGPRPVNVDPGYIALEHVVLGTTKGYSHRIYLGKGIFADLTLLYENGSYRRLKWTYPDYGSDQLILLLNGWRAHYKGLLRCQRV